jgi:cell division protease FtsH
MEYGMSDKLGTLQFGNTQGQVFLGRDIGHEQNYSDTIAYEIDMEMQAMIRGCYDKAKEILTTYSEQVHLIANKLLELETLERDQIRSLLETGELSATPKVTIKEQEATNDANRLDFDKVDGEEQV